MRARATAICSPVFLLIGWLLAGSATAQPHVQQGPPPILIEPPQALPAPHVLPPAAPVLEVDLRHRPHLFFGGQLMGIATAAQTTEYETGYLGHFGGGIGLFAGYRLNPLISLEGNWTFSLHDEAWEEHHGAGVQMGSLYIMSFTVDAKLYLQSSMRLPASSMVEPYLQAGGGYLVAGAIDLVDQQQHSRQSVFSSGGVFNLGGGLDIWITPHISLGGRCLYRGMVLGKPGFSQVVETGYRNFASSVSVEAFATIHL